MTGAPAPSASSYDVIIIGAGAAGMMCAREAALRGRRVCVIEHTKKPGEKIRISGGGRCNFTNLYARPETFISQNPRFCISALARYSPQDFIALLAAHHIAWHEKPAEDGADQSARGQLFCDGKSSQIIEMLRGDAQSAGAGFMLQTAITAISKEGDQFTIATDQGHYQSAALVVASGGLSIPKIGASPFGYRLAEQFGLKIIPPRAGLVPLTFDEAALAKTRELSGLGLTARAASASGQRFTEGLLFTHRGLSGPVILQISSYWQPGEALTLDYAPGHDVFERLRSARRDQPRQKLGGALATIVPKRLAALLAAQSGFEGANLADLSDAQLRQSADLINSATITPQGSEGYRTAEVTLGGVDTNELSSKTMEARKVPGLYFIGEVVDVTGHLGGHNFQWAWASAIAAAHHV